MPWDRNIIFHMVQQAKSCGWFGISDLEILEQLLHIFVNLVSCSKDNTVPDTVQT
jgi:hypothetical protein